MIIQLLCQLIVKITVLLTNFVFVFTVFIALSFSQEDIYNYDKLKAVSTPRVYNSQEWKNLLHYDKNKSSIDKNSNFFLSPIGYKNPKDEFLATLKAITDTSLVDDRSIICRYPARFEYIKRSLNLTDNHFKQQNCKKYNEFLAKVPIDTVSFVFASENNKNPLSIMGHSFLKLSGKDPNGILKQHSFSYFAIFDRRKNIFNILFNILLKGVNGYYALTPYKEKVDGYLIGEKRNIWEFDLKLNNKEISQFKKHLWELKDVHIKYSIISHNCNTATANILKIINNDFMEKSVKPFETPVEYIQKLYDMDKIMNVSIEPTEYTKQKIKKNGSVKNILTANKSSRIEYKYSKHYSFLTTLPIYQDIRDINSAYFDEMESKIGEIAFGYKSNFFIDKIDFLKIRSIGDYSIQNKLSTHFRLAVENNFHTQTTNLKPTIEFGLGYGFYKKNITFYLLPTVGYRYNHFNNFYITPEIGIIAGNDKLKFLTSYKYYFDSSKNNRGYKNIFNVSIGYKIFENMDIHIEYNYYTKAIVNNLLSVGLVYRF